MHLKKERMASTTKLSVQERKDLDKFTKFLTLKMVQIIVQSRLGEKIKTKSKPHSSGSDWFNLSIKDLPEVQEESKKALAGQVPTIGLGMCVEISLKTVDGDTMVLETWFLEMSEQFDSTVRVTYTVYNRMSLLLKSLISVTRVTPAYKLSSLQGPGSFVICYRVYLGEPHWSSLGECFHRVKVGQVGTPIGTLILSVAYRTQLTITPQKGSNRDGLFMVKSDHFKPDLSPKGNHHPSHSGFYMENRSVVDELAAACEDSKMDACPVIANGEKKTLTRNNKENDVSPTCTWQKQVSFSDCKKVGAFATEPRKAEGTENTDYFIPDVPFSTLLQPRACDVATVNHRNSTTCKNGIGDAVIANNNHGHLCSADDGEASDAESTKSNGSVTSAVEDFVLVELKPPFAGADGANDLGTFFRECQTAPPLVSFSDQPSLENQISDLTSQLAAFETNLPEFDDFVESLYQEESAK